MGQLVSQPITDKTTTVCDSEDFSYVIGSCQGWRVTMEDAHCAVEEVVKVTRKQPIITNNMNLGKDPNVKIIENSEVLNIKVFGVFDGHGGVDSAEFVAQNLPICIINEFRNCYLPNDENNDVFKIIKNAFLKCDNNLYFKNFHCGCTGTAIVVLNNTQVFVANTGDSRCVLSRNGAAKNLSFDHKPSNIGELLRIKDAGGMVSMNRVNGSLALSRAFGDFNFKRKVFSVEDPDSSIDSNFGERNNNNHKFGLFKNKKLSAQRHMHATVEQWIPSEETQVTVEPEIISLRLNKANDEFLILACDGIWDTFSNKSLVQMIRKDLCLGLRLNKICENVIDTVLDNTDSNTGIGFDNMTILIVALHDEKEGETLDAWYEKMKQRVEKEKGLV